MATAKDPDERYQSAKELAEDLGRLLDGSSVLAPAYRYRLDMSEIKASRPRSVLVLSIFLFSWVPQLGIGFLVTLFNQLNGFRSNDFETLSTLVLTFVGVLLCPLVGWGLLAGRLWSQWCSVLLCGITGFFFLTFWPPIMNVSKLSYDSLILYTLLWALGLVLLFCATLPFRGSASVWFRLAHQRRQEHKAHTKRR